MPQPMSGSSPIAHGVCSAPAQTPPERLHEVHAMWHIVRLHGIMRPPEASQALQSLHIRQYRMPSGSNGSPSSPHETGE